MSDESTEHDEADLTRDRVLSDTLVRPLDNSKAVLADIDREALSERESSRLNTIERKINELRDIRADNIREESTDV
jgi:hypothetical protein